MLQRWRGRSDELRGDAEGCGPASTRPAVGIRLAVTIKRRLAAMDWAAVRERRAQWSGAPEAAAGLGTRLSLTETLEQSERQLDEERDQRVWLPGRRRAGAFTEQRPRRVARGVAGAPTTEHVRRCTHGVPHDPLAPCRRVIRSARRAFHAHALAHP